MAKRPNPELVKYIEKHLAKGFKIKHVKQRLAEVGHPIEAIEDAAKFVLLANPNLKKKDMKFMVIYGLILIVVIAALVYFIATKTTEQLDYVEQIEEIEKTEEFKGMTDIELIKYAKANNDLTACSAIEDHNLYYSCIDKYWERGDCVYERLIGEGVSCFTDKALGSNDWLLCGSIKSIDDKTACRISVAKKIASENSPEDCKGNPACLWGFINERGVVSLGENFCETTAYLFRDDCLLRLAIDSSDSSVCDKIEDIPLRFRCFASLTSSFDDIESVCFGDAAYQNFNFSDSVNLDLLRASCFLGVAESVQGRNSLSCSDILSFAEADDSVFSLAFRKVYKSEPAIFSCD